MILFDDLQKSVLNSILESDGLYQRITSIFTDSKISAYIYGGVGTGKTTVMKEYYKNFNRKKMFLHYQKFSNEIQRKLYNSDIEKISKEYIEFDLICIDEFEIRDITDAMIMKKLFGILFDARVKIIFTTNVHPDEIYKDGLKREDFLPFIEDLKSHCNIFCLDKGLDYRFSFSKEKVFFYGEERKDFLSLVSSITANMSFDSKTISVFGRLVKFELVYKNILYVDFDDLCKKPLGFQDYGEICTNFEMIILDNIPEFDDSDFTLRFIYLIDQIYANNTFFVCFFYTNCVYNGTRFNEFKRTISRLEEIQARIKN